MHDFGSSCRDPRHQGCFERKRCRLFLTRIMLYNSPTHVTTQRKRADEKPVPSYEPQPLHGKNRASTLFSNAVFTLGFQGDSKRRGCTPLQVQVAPCSEDGLTGQLQLQLTMQCVRSSLSTVSDAELPIPGIFQDAGCLQKFQELPE